MVGFFLQKHRKTTAFFWPFLSVGGVAELPQVGRGSHWRVQPLGSPRVSGAEPGRVEALPLGPGNWDRCGTVLGALKLLEDATTLGVMPRWAKPL